MAAEEHLARITALPGKSRREALPKYAKQAELSQILPEICREMQRAEQSGQQQAKPPG